MDVFSKDFESIYMENPSVSEFELSFDIYHISMKQFVCFCYVVWRSLKRSSWSHIFHEPEAIGLVCSRYRGPYFESRIFRFDGLASPCARNCCKKATMRELSSAT